MTKQELLARVAAVISALAELNAGTSESMIYMLCGMNMDEYEMLRDVLVRSKLVTIQNNFVTLTPFGKQKGDEINHRVAV